MAIIESASSLAVVRRKHRQESNDHQLEIPQTRGFHHHSEGKGKHDPFDILPSVSDYMASKTEQPSRMVVRVPLPFATRRLSEQFRSRWALVLAHPTYATHAAHATRVLQDENSLASPSVLV